MGALLFILVLGIIFIGGGWLIGKGLGEFLFGRDTTTKYVDRSVHHHYHTTNNIVNNENKSISIIDDATKQKIFELKENKENKKATN